MLGPSTHELSFEGSKVGILGLVGLVDYFAWLAGDLPDLGGAMQPLYVLVPLQY